MHACRLVLASCLSLAISGGVSRAAQFRLLDMPDKSGSAILMSGEIVPGDEDTFHKLAATLSDAKLLTTGPGGIVITAIKIGNEVRARGWSTLVPAGAMCASACSLIWLAGQSRLLGTGAQIGFHAISVPDKHGGRAETHEMDAFLRTWLSNLGYAFDATATITNTQATSIRWYDVTDLRANGIPTDPYP